MPCSASSIASIRPTAAEVEAGRAATTQLEALQKQKVELDFQIQQNGKKIAVAEQAAKDATHPRSASRPPSDREVLADIAARLDEVLERG